MLKYEELRKSKKQFLALTGITIEEFEKVLPVFIRVYERKKLSNKTQQGKERKIKVVVGRGSQIKSHEQKLLFALVYEKTYPIQEMMAVLFGLDQGQVNRWLHRLLPILKEALDELGLLPEREGSKFARHERGKGKKAPLIIDGVDRRRQRPKNKEKQKLHYSGRKKTHTDKNVVIVNAKTKRVGFLSSTYAGKVNDKKIADEESISYPRNSTLYKDTGFQGYEPEKVATQQPKKNRVKGS